MTHPAVPRPFEGIRVIDITHVLAGPFATYQLAVHGADVIKVENPDDPDMVRILGSDAGDNERQMGSAFLTQASNKRAVTLDLKRPEGQAVLKRLAATADVLVENFRPGALAALGLGYEDLAAVNQRLIYASFSAFGQDGPRGNYTAYDHVIQASSGIMATTGEIGGRPIKFGSPVIDYATGTTGAFALATALFQRERTGKGQHIDMAMMDVALVMMASHVTDFTRSGHHPEPHGDWQGSASGSCWPTRDGLLMLGAMNIAQQRRFWAAVGREDMAKTTHAEPRPTKRGKSRSSPKPFSPARPMSGRCSSRPATSPPAACGGWRRRWRIRSWIIARFCIAMKRSPALAVASPCRLRPSNSLMAARASTHRRPLWDVTLKRCSVNSVIPAPRSRHCGRAASYRASLVRLRTRGFTGAAPHARTTRAEPAGSRPSLARSGGGYRTTGATRWSVRSRPAEKIDRGSVGAMP